MYHLHASYLGGVIHLGDVIGYVDNLYITRKFAMERGLGEARPCTLGGADIGYVGPSCIRVGASRPGRFLAPTSATSKRGGGLGSHNRAGGELLLGG